MVLSRRPGEREDDQCNNTSKIKPWFYLADPASVKTITGERTVDQDQSATLGCEADANPVVEQVVLWSRPGYDMTRALLVSACIHMDTYTHAQIVICHMSGKVHAYVHTDALHTRTYGDL